MKELKNIDLNDVISLRILQFKSYLKILDILYFWENTNLSVILNIIWVDICDLQNGIKPWCSVMQELLEVELHHVHISHA